MLSYPVNFVPSSTYRNFIGWPLTLLGAVWAMRVLIAKTTQVEKPLPESGRIIMPIVCFMSAGILFQYGFPAAITTVAGNAYSVEAIITDKTKSRRGYDGCR